MKFIVIGFLLSIQGFAGSKTEIRQKCSSKIASWPWSVPDWVVSEAKDLDYQCMYQVLLVQSTYLKDAQKICINQCIDRKKAENDYRTSK